MQQQFIKKWNMKFAATDGTSQCGWWIMSDSGITSMGYICKCIF